MATATKGKKNQKIEAAVQTTVLNSVKGLKLADAISDLGQTQVSVQKTFADLSATLTDKLTQLQNIDTAIDLKEGRLSELHQIEAAAVTLDEIQAQIEDAQRQADEADETRRQTWAVQDAERATARKREQEQYEYSTAQARKKSEDDFSAEVARKQREETIRQENLLKNWQEREAKLKAEEKEVNELKLRVANIQNEIDAAVKSKVEQVGGAMKRDYEQKTQITEINAANERKLADAQNASLKADNARLVQQISEIQVQLQEANRRVETISAKAVEASAGRQALEAIQRQTETMSAQTGKSR